MPLDAVAQAGKRLQGGLALSFVLVVLLFSITQGWHVSSSALLSASASDVANVVAAASQEIAKIKALHEQRMAEAEEQLRQLRDRDKREQRKSNAMLTNDENALAAEIVQSAEENRKVSTFAPGNLTVECNTPLTDVEHAR